MISVTPLGCYGSSLEEKECISMALSESIIIDAGGIMASVPAEKLPEIKHLIITHSHYDHIKDIPMLSDFTLIEKAGFFTIHALQSTINDIMEHVFNNKTWPDFSSLPSKKNPTVKFEVIVPGIPFDIEGLNFFPIAVDHTVSALGFLIKKEKVAIGYSGDTFLCQDLIDAFNKEPDIKALFWEASFSSELERIAILSKHLTPKLMYKDVSQIQHKVPVYLFHMKPTLLKAIEREVNDINKKHDMEMYLMKQNTTIIVR